MKAGKSYRKKVKEEHVALVQEVGAEYMGHYSVTCGFAEGISKGLFQYAEENNIDLKDLVAIGCDGTVVNTGEKGGAIRMIELKLNKPVHHFICQPHANELPLRHLVEKLDGKTSGPHGFTGPIGKLLNNYENLPIVAFEKKLMQKDKLCIVKILVLTKNTYLKFTKQLSQEFVHQIWLLATQERWPTPVGLRLLTACFVCTSQLIIFPRSASALCSTQCKFMYQCGFQLSKAHLL